MPLSFRDRQKCIAFNQHVRSYTGDPKVIALWNDFLVKAFHATRGPYMDGQAHRAMVDAACAFRKAGDLVVDECRSAIRGIEVQMGKCTSGSARWQELSAQRDKLLEKIEAERANVPIRTKLMPQGIGLIGNLAAMGLPQYAAGREIIEALDFMPPIVKKDDDAEQTPLPHSGTRQIPDRAPASGRRLSATG